MSRASNQTQKPFILGSTRGEALAAIEGLFLTVEQGKRFEAWDNAGKTTEEMRTEIRKRYEALSKGE